MKRKITEKQEKILKLCHHKFQGRTRQEATDKIGCSAQSISRILRQIKKVLPQFFPILTKQQHQVNQLLEQGCNRQEIAERLDCDLKFVDNIIQQLHKKGYDKIQSHKPIQYRPHMDSEVKEKF